MEIVIGGDKLGAWQAIDDTREVAAYANDHIGHFHLRTVADPDTDVVVTFDWLAVAASPGQWRTASENLEVTAYGTHSLLVRPRQ
jgi:hypothetical protein